MIIIGDVYIQCYFSIIYIQFFQLVILVLQLIGAMCKIFEYLLTEMQYDIHNYVFSGV